MVKTVKFTKMLLLLQLLMEFNSDWFISLIQPLFTIRPRRISTSWIFGGKFQKFWTLSSSLTHGWALHHWRSGSNKCTDTALACVINFYWLTRDPVIQSEHRFHFTTENGHIQGKVVVNKQNTQKCNYFTPSMENAFWKGKSLTLQR